MTSTIYTSASTTDFLIRPLRRRQRWVLAPAAAVAAAAHVPVIAPHLDEAPYMGVLFIVLTVGCAAIAAAALLRDSAAVYALAVLTGGLAVIGYAATRLVGFPMLADDVGNWFELLGVLSVITEIMVVATALAALRSHGQDHATAAMTAAAPEHANRHRPAQVRYAAQRRTAHRRLRSGRGARWRTVRARSRSGSR